jgi:NAD(P) transhydrogenase subunit beta
MTPVIVELLYILSIALFALSLKWMSEVRTSRYANWAAMGGMAIAIAGTLIAYQIGRFDLLIVAVLVGALVGTPIGLKVSMTAVPQRTAISQACGSLAVALVGVAEYFNRVPELDTFTMSVLGGEIILGFLTFTGSCIAFMKLQGLIPGKPYVYKGRNVVTIALLGLATAFTIYLILNPAQLSILPIMIFLALLVGLNLVMGIGGADMPTVIATLNSFAGLSAAALGFVLNNKILIVAGALDGSSGLILAIIMSQAMNRSFVNILFGSVGKTIKGVEAAQAGRSVQQYSPEDVAIVLEGAKSVIVAPGYGMGVAQAQFVVKELADLLSKIGADVKFAIHPVAGRMPGHMNVLLAEANVSYDQLWEMEKINPLFPQADVAIVVGANDVTNPAARDKSDSPLYGMPILDVDKAKTIVFIKRGRGTGFSGVDNDLFYLQNTMMVFGDAKQVVTDLVTELKKRAG